MVGSRRDMDLVLQIWRGLNSRLAALVLRLRGTQISGHVWMRSVDVPRNAWDIELADGVALDRGVSLIATGPRGSSPRIRIGTSTYVNRYSIIDASESIVIGANCLVGPHCYLTDHDHAMDGANRKSDLPSAATVLDNEVWLGAHVTVLKGVSIGTGSVIGAGSVVTRDIPPHSLALGTPARVVRNLTSTPDTESNE